MINRDDLKDHLKPSPVCIKTEEVNRRGDVDNSEAITNLVEKLPDSIIESRKVQINLNDCLACSGCITSAETVLVAHHTSSLFQNILDQNAKSQPRRKVVVTVSPQSRVSIARKLNVGLSEAEHLIAGFLKNKLQVDYVYDSNFARAISLLSTWGEFKDQLESRRCLVTSACPGWICFVEKTQPHLIPLISATRSPQQMMGIYVREIVDPQAIHATVMPCYDKKLEASRSDFEGEIDCVLTTTELFNLIMQAEEDLSRAARDAFDRGIFVNGQLAGNFGSGSDGYLDYVIHRLEEDMRASVECTRTTRDHSEYTASLPDGRQIRLAAIYGFSNIQNLVRKAKTSSIEYSFVEVMACPGACLNGGGQIKAGNTITLPSDKRAFLEGLGELYRNTPPVWPETDVETVEAYNSLLLKGTSLTTGYHSVKESVASGAAFQVKW